MEAIEVFKQALPDTIYTCMILEGYRVPFRRVVMLTYNAQEVSNREEQAVVNMYRTAIEAVENDGFKITLDDVSKMLKALTAGTLHELSMPVVDTYTEELFKALETHAQTIDGALEVFDILLQYPVIKVGNTWAAVIMMNKVLVEAGVEALRVPIGDTGKLRDLIQDYRDNGDTTELNTFLVDRISFI